MTQNTRTVPATRRLLRVPDDLFEDCRFFLRDGFQTQASIARLTSNTTQGKSNRRVSEREVTT